MQLAPGTHIPDGLLATMTPLSEKPRHGVTSWESAPHPGIAFRISSTSIDFRFRGCEIVSGPVVAPNNQILPCFVKGAGTGLLTGLAVAGGTALAATVLAPEVVTGCAASGWSLWWILAVSEC